MVRLGIDIGGSGMKAAIVETETGELVSDRIKLITPKPANPANMSKVLKELVSSFNYNSQIGVSFPTIVENNVALSYGNIDPLWMNVQIDKLFNETTGHEYIIANDADLAGMAEMTMGAGQGLEGKVIMITIGTGLGTGIFYNGILVPNIELGRILSKNGKPIEFYAGDRARKKNGLTWEDWGKRFDFFLRHLDRTFSPNHYIIGGGASKKWHKFQEQITSNTPIHIARFLNNAGIIGAALYSELMTNKS